MRELVIITGITASGKTSAAIEAALREGGKILSSDAFCVYRGMDIGTAKPTVAEQSKVPHFGIDLVPVAETYSLHRYVDYSRRLLENCPEKRWVVVGGSGFYLKSFFEPLTDGIEVEAAVVERVEEIWVERGLPGMVEELRSVCGGEDRIGAGLDTSNPRRVRKALERCLQTGRSHRELEYEFHTQPKPFAEWKKRLVLIERDPVEMEERNRLRVAAMVDSGLIEEVERLRGQGLEKNPSAASAIGYRETLDYLDGRLARDKLETAIVDNTRKLMKKQRSWIRNQLPAPDEIRTCTG